MDNLNVPDVLTVEVPATGQVLVVSDLHLSPAATAAAAWAGRDLSDRLESWSGAGVLVLAGDVLELLGPDVADPAAVLAAHPRLTASIRTFAQGDGRQVVYLVGNHDSRLAGTGSGRRRWAPCWKPSWPWLSSCVSTRAAAWSGSGWSTATASTPPTS